MLAAGTKPTSGPVSAISAIDPELDIAVLTARRVSSTMRGSPSNAWLDINAKLANDWFVRVSIYIKAAV
jgi:hypothetical protein